MNTKDIYRGKRVNTPYGIGTVEVMPMNNESDTLMVELDRPTFNYFGQKAHKFVVVSLKQLKEIECAPIPEQIKNNASFKYQAYHFIPAGVFSDYNIEEDFFAITKCLTRDWVMGIWNKGQGDNARFDWNVNDFYTQAGKRTNDIFYCVEMAHFYVPCENELFMLKTECIQQKFGEFKNNH